MTTIAVSVVEGIMCSDSLWHDGVKTGSMRKVIRTPEGLIGFAGTYSEWVRWYEAYQVDPNPSITTEDLDIVMLTASGIFTWNPTDKWFPIAEKFYAIGSGSDFAIGAMEAGATAAQAIQIACRRGANSRGPIRRYKL